MKMSVVIKRDLAKKRLTDEAARKLKSNCSAVDLRLSMLCNSSLSLDFKKKLLTKKVFDELLSPYSFRNYEKLKWELPEAVRNLIENEIAVKDILE